MKLGIVGLPNVGKSTLFNAITKAGAEAANYPFCTIEPNVGVVSVPDKRLDKLAEIYNPEKYTPAVVEFVDIAGLVAGREDVYFYPSSLPERFDLPSWLRMCLGVGYMGIRATYQSTLCRDYRPCAPGLLPCYAQA